MGDEYISREETLADLQDILNDPACPIFIAATVEQIISLLPAAEVRPVVQIVDRLDEERKKAKGQWHTDRYWLGWVDAMRRARRIVDGSIDEEPYFVPSGADTREKGAQK